MDLFRWPLHEPHNSAIGLIGSSDALQCVVMKKESAKQSNIVENTASSRPRHVGSAW